MSLTIDDVEKVASLARLAMTHAWPNRPFRIRAGYDCSALITGHWLEKLAPMQPSCLMACGNQHIGDHQSASARVYAITFRLIGKQRNVLSFAPVATAEMCERGPVSMPCRRPSRRPGGSAHGGSAPACRQLSPVDRSVSERYQCAQGSI